jgi:glycosyltransferase involved in cell wall biosynthesis
VKLVLINYSMNSNSLLFSHQRETVLALAPYFTSIDVFTPEPNSNSLPSNVKVFKLAWKKTKLFSNIFTIYKILLPFFVKNRDVIVFSHMTDVHAALISPLTWIFRIRHVLWYAHAYNSIFLMWSSFFLTKIVSSTAGSCTLNLNKKKIVYINQGIKYQDFPYSGRNSLQENKAFYYGRLDESKNIHRLVELVSVLNGLGKSISIDIFGKPSSNRSKIYLARIKSSQIYMALSSKVSFRGPIERKKIPLIAKEYQFFINLFTGSLDKTLLEATFLGIPVITWNKEFCSQFGTWSRQPVEDSLEFVTNEIVALRSLELGELQSELFFRFERAIKLHSFEGWIGRLVNILKEENNK